LFEHDHPQTVVTRAKLARRGETDDPCAQDGHVALAGRICSGHRRDPRRRSAGLGSLAWLCR